LFATATSLWVQSLEANSSLADNRQAQHPYNAACCATLAAAGQGRDVPTPDDGAKTKLRQQALVWLKAELAAWTGFIATADQQQRRFIAATLQHWQDDPDLASIRDTGALAELADAERAAFTQLWADVAALLKQAQQ
jgi:hypothetical protein